MRSRQFNIHARRAFRLASIARTTLLLTALAAFGQPALAERLCTDDGGVYIAAYKYYGNYNRGYTENATLAGEVEIKKSLDAKQTITLYPYVRNDIPDTAAANFPASSTLALWSGIRLAKDNQIKVVLGDTRGTCSYPSGSYFDAIRLKKIGSP